MDTSDRLNDRSILAARCHEIQLSLGTTEVTEFEALTEIGMAVRLALHIRGLPDVDFQVLKQVSQYFLNIPLLAVERIVKLLAEAEMVQISTEGNTIKKVIPTVPYYDDLYDRMGEYATTQRKFNEAEQLATYLVDRLSESPEIVDSLKQRCGAESKLFDRNLKIGLEGSYLVSERYRGKSIVFTPTYFSENGEVFADAVACQGSGSVRKLLNAIKSYQGYPLSIIEAKKNIGEIEITDGQIALLKRLSQDAAIKPPSIETSHAGINYFLFTPTPYSNSLGPKKREIYEKAMAVVAAIRQGELLPRRYAIRSPRAVIYKLRYDLKLGKATTEFAEQYRNLVHLRVGRLISIGGRYYHFEIIDTPENNEALEIAYDLIYMGEAGGMEIDDDARFALQQDQKYVESIISSNDLRRRESVKLSHQEQLNLEALFVGGNLK
jgi:hypothetical protein